MGILWVIPNKDWSWKPIFCSSGFAIDLFLKFTSEIPNAPTIFPKLKIGVHATIFNITDIRSIHTQSCRKVSLRHILLQA